MRRRPGYVTILLLSLMLGVSVVVVYGYRVTDALLRRARAEYTEYLGARNLMKAAAFEEKLPVLKIQEMRRWDELSYVAFLHYGSPEARPFSEPETSRLFKADIEAAITRYLPEWGREPDRALIELRGFDETNEGRWMFIPCLRYMTQSSGRIPAEVIFQFLLYSKPYLGAERETARRTWEQIRRTESANTGRDSLGMYQGSSF